VLSIKDGDNFKGDSMLATLRRTSQQAFDSGSKGLLVLVTHEGAGLFDKISTKQSWNKIPRLQIWAAEQVETIASSRDAQIVADTVILTRPVLERLHAPDKFWHVSSIAKIHDAIAAGRLYQLCLTFPLWFKPLPCYGELFKWMMQEHPVEFGAWVRLPGLELASCSPENFLSLRAGQVSTRPMKGTRRLERGRETQILHELKYATKDLAENTMIVDVSRNDLARVCRPGSVQVPQLHHIEQYRSVAQMTSTITGSLRPECDVWDLLSAAFPPASMTGAPKIEACRMIQELEFSPRGLYGGTLGWIEPNGDANFSVIIRSMQSWQGQARWDVGGGIVHDSEATAEWKEAWAKVAVLGELPEIT